MGEVILFFLLASVGLGHCSDDNSSVNVATRGRATQSSTFELKGSAKHAIDGSRNSDYNKSSCSKTDGGTNSWWRVDLLDTYEVSSVTITNRDQLPERINRAEIRIGNSLENDGNSNPRCAVISSVPAGGSTTFQCRGMQGRYVNVFLPGYKQYLTLCEVEVYATPLHSVGPSQTLELDLAVPVTENVALGKTAVLSSEYNSNRRGSKAVDGEHNCQNAYSRTKTQTNPWWRVDLLQSYNITSITVVNIEDDNPEMIDGAEIRIGNSLENNGNNNPLCAVISSYPAWRARMFQCRRMEGRYVNILLPGCDKHLALCEVEVNVGLDKENDMRVLTSSTIDSETRAQFLLRQQDDIVCPNHKSKDKTIQENASTGGVATQSSQWDKDGSASNAVDQDRTSVYTSGSCSHTKAEIDPWWRVDLKKNYNITFVTVTNRGDCCSERISGAEIHVGHSLMNNGNSNPICAVIPYIPLGQTRTFSCGGMEGQYVNILLPGREKYLTLCEVEVHASNFKREYAPPTESPPTNPYLAWLWEPLRQLRHRFILKGNVALMGRAVQSSQFTQLTSAENAIDGRLDTDYLSGSCTQTRLQSDPWWRVDLMAIHKVSYITITNREDCCAWRLDGAQILVGNSLQNNGNNNPVCFEITSIPAGESVTFQCNGMEGRYINIIRHGCFKILTVCEVEVYGESLQEALTDTQQESSESQIANRGCTQACETQCPVENIPQNLASDGLATQSSEYDNLGSASNAIDRKRDPLYHSGSCSHTKAETNPWWRLDLLGIFYVTSVSITNRGDCCHTRITGAEIRIGNHLDGAKSLLCAVIPEMKEGEVREFSCGEMEGRYVTVVLPGKEKSLSLCEVEVHGGPRKE